MKHVKVMECEQGKGFLCQSCDEAFFHLGEEEPVCPKCGISGSNWLLSLSVQEEEDEQPTAPGKGGISSKEGGAV